MDKKLHDLEKRIEILEEKHGGCGCKGGRHDNKKNDEDDIKVISIPMSSKFEGGDVKKGQCGGKKTKAGKVAKKKRVPSKYNLFVKKNYPIMKSKHPKLNMIEINKKISEEWNKQK